MGRDLVASAGWAVFVGFGIALGLWLGSIGADVPADSEMLVLTGLVAAAGTLVVRVFMTVWKYRPAARPLPPAEPEPEPEPEPERPRRRRPVQAAGRGSSGTRTRGVARKAPARRKPGGPRSSRA